MAFPRETNLLENVSVDTNGVGVQSDGSAKSVAIWATSFGGGTVTLQGSPDNGVTWIDLTIAGATAAFSANVIRVIDYLGQGLQMRAILVGATSPVNVNAKIF